MVIALCQRTPNHLSLYATPATSVLALLVWRRKMILAQHNTAAPQDATLNQLMAKFLLKRERTNAVQTKYLRYI